MKHFALICAACAVVVSSCVNNKFNLNNLDRSVQLLAGFELAINPSGQTRLFSALEFIGELSNQDGSGINVPLASDSRFSFQRGLSVFEDFMVDFKELGINYSGSKKFEIKALMRTDLPIELYANSIDGGNADAAISKITADNPDVWHEFTITVSAPEGILSVDRIDFGFEARALGEINLKDNSHYFEIKPETIKLIDGINLEL